MLTRFLTIHGTKTESWDNSGLPHTLEHLIFCGSRRYPEKGYLDSLASRAISNGTNAYTSEDHTCYTFTSASFEGLLDVIPVYLDHIFDPLLLQRHFKDEVFHNENGKKSGVVYSEMTARCLSEADLMDINIRKVAYGNDSFLAKECGGFPNDIETLTIERIKEYHRHYYDIAKACIIISGPLIEELLVPVLNSSLELYKKESICSKSFDIVLTSTSSSTVIAFPSNDDEYGSVGFVFNGPTITSPNLVMATNILIRALSENSSSPLLQEFVECNPPLANTIDMELKLYSQSVITIIFSGVAAGETFEDDDTCTSEDDVDSYNCLDPGFMKHKLSSFLYNLSTHNFDTLLESIHHSLKRYKDKYMEHQEEDPHDIFFSSTLCDFIATIPLGSSLNKLKILSELEIMTAEEWKTIFCQSFLKSPVREIICVPKTNYFDLYPFHRFENFKCPDSINHPDIEPLIILDSIFPSNHNYYEKIVEYQPSLILSNLFNCVQLVELSESTLFHLSLCFDISLLSADLRLYLVVFQELLFQSAVKVYRSDLCPSLRLKDDDVIIYDDFVKLYNQYCLQLEGSVGFDNNLFTCSQMGNLFIVSMTCLRENRDIAMYLLLLAIFHPVHDPSRLEVIMKNLTSHLKETLREGGDVLDNILSCALKTLYNSSQFLAKAADIESSICIFEQERQLAKFSNDIDGTLDKITCISEFLSRAIFKNLFVQLSTSCNNEAFIDNFANLWVSLCKFPSPKQESKDINPYFKFSSFHFPQLETSSIMGNAYIYGIGGLTTCHLSVTTICDVYDPIKSCLDYHAVIVLCQLLSRTEGPLYTAIRGKGSAYDVNISLASWSRNLTISILDSVDPIGAFDAVLDVFSELEMEIQKDVYEKLLSDFNIETAIATAAYHSISHRASPAALVDYLRQMQFRGLTTAKDIVEFDSLISNIQRNDLVRVYKRYFKSFLNLSKTNLTACLVCDPTKVEIYKKAFQPHFTMTEFSYDT